MSCGEISSSKQSRRHPLDWCVEQGWEWEQIAAEIGLDVEQADGCAIWDPCAGYGHSASRLQGIGFDGPQLLSDLVNNVAWDEFADRGNATFFSADFLELERAPTDGPISIWCNPPFSYLKGILEAFARQALRLATHRVVMLAPLKWLDPGKARSRFFRLDHPPQKILYFTTRPSMPPGDVIHLLGDKAYSGGMISYIALVWDVRHPTAPGDTRSIWLPLLGERG